MKIAIRAEITDAESRILFKMELYKRYRPKTLANVHGQQCTISMLEGLLEKNQLPHCLLVHGPSGCGKTTLARILRRRLRCGREDYQEINSADFRGVEMVRDIRSYAPLAPLSGQCRIWVIDEAHKLTNDAQNAFLKLLEDMPKHVYFFLLTTDAQKLISAIHTRATEIRLRPLTEQELCVLLNQVANAEGVKISEDIVDEIALAAEGSPRKALVILDQVRHAPSAAQQRQMIQRAALTKTETIALARALMNPQAQWPGVASLLKALKDEDVEEIRYLILGYARTVLLNGGRLAPRAFMILEVFGRNFYDAKHAGLAAACWEVIRDRRRDNEIRVQKAR